jgi:microsomal epoxide hydrolase
VVRALGPRRVLLVGWSLGVLDSLAYVHEHGDGALAGLVLVDNSVGEPPAPVLREAPVRRGPRVDREVSMRRFVASMFRRDPGPTYLDELTEAALRTPPDAANALLSYPVPRTYWREAVLSAHVPVLYVVRPHLAAQAANLAAEDPAAETEVFRDAGHALFVDDAARFDAALSDFIQRRVRW